MTWQGWGVLSLLASSWGWASPYSVSSCTASWRCPVGATTPPEEGEGFLVVVVAFLLLGIAAAILCWGQATDSDKGEG